ncbi:MAG: uracil-DNA glycosylase [Burkholderiaceae bacterium]|nr:MAG: uracil-DNA glycosylase [Burkholderiaceae bacterium]
MRWSERQRAMLGAMGITLWGPDRVEARDAPATTVPRPRDPGAAVACADTPARAEASARAAGGVRAAFVAAPAPDAADIATLDWNALRARVASCRACRLCESRTQTVFGVGNPRAHCMIVGEAPGENEDLQGEPFVGSAGQLLDRMLLAIGLTRGEAEPAQQVFIANTLKCRPPRNRNPEPAELARCSAYLVRQIELVQPKLLLAMGRFAVQALLDSSEPIGRLRGRVHRWRDLPVVVTYHPAYLLRNPADKVRAWADLCLAATLLAR